ncbi:histidine phosphatase family protein [uncultured Desulfobacter sp.]|uniref:histidine phosphatase family protein n=1 Tax=uncultured Desulfobacter sp. TaxID=240139 RepID=UPI002AA82850|nr:histidine phosphatase family protein [uncultured Desulfobacter sp.]
MDTSRSVKLMTLNPEQQKKLFNILIVEIIVVAIAYFKGFLTTQPESNKTTQPESNKTTQPESNKTQDKDEWDWCDAEQVAKDIHNKLEEDNFIPTLLVGTGRGGAIMGALISGCFGHIPLVVIDRKYAWSNGRRKDGILFNVLLPPHLIEKVLIVDGQAHTGMTMRFYDNYLKKMGASEIRKACFFVSKRSLEYIHYYGFQSDKILKLPWVCSSNFKSEAHVDEKLGNAPDSDIKHSREQNYIYLVRHGQTTASIDGERFTGITNCELTDVGIEEAIAVSTELASKDNDIGIIFTSPMKRAIKTAREIQRKLKVQLIIDERLKEIDYGDWENEKRSDIKTASPDDYQNYTKDPVRFCPENSESPVSAKDRIIAFWDDLLESPSLFAEKGIVLVSHNSILRILLTHIEKKPLFKYRKSIISTGSITKIEIGIDGKAVVRDKNVTNKDRSCEERTTILSDC